MARQESPLRRALRRTGGGLIGALSLAYLILFIHPIQVLSAPLALVSRTLVRRINRWCARSVWGMWVLLAERIHGMDFRFYGDDVAPRENAIVIANHQSMADVMVLMTFAWRKGRLGDMKWFVKDIVKYVPGPGWGMLFLDCVFLKRNWMKDRDRIRGTFHKFRRDDIPLYLVSFLEGTRFTPEKHARAVKFAQERGLPVPERTLVPRTKGFVATMTGLRDYADAVYDITIAYDDEVPTLWGGCFAGAHHRTHFHVRRFAVNEIPEDPDALTEWVFERYREKDALLAEHARTGAFPEPMTQSVRVRVRDWLLSETRIDAGAR